MTGMAVAATSATLASFTGLRGLGLLTGWPNELAWLLPVTIDAYAMTSARVWLAPGSMSRSARRFARANALGAIATSISGNAVYHAAHAGLLTISWPMIVTVGAVPAAVLGLTAHLHALRGRPDLHSSASETLKDGGDAVSHAEPVHDEQAPDPVPTPEVTVDALPVPSPRTEPPAQATSTRPERPGPAEDDLLIAAIKADHEYRQTHGRPITRDALRAALHISTSRATQLRRRIERNHPSEGTTTRNPYLDPEALTTSTAQRKETANNR